MSLLLTGVPGAPEGLAAWVQVLGHCLREDREGGGFDL